MNAFKVICFSCLLTGSIFADESDSKPASGGTTDSGKPGQFAPSVGKDYHPGTQSPTMKTPPSPLGSSATAPRMILSAPAVSVPPAPVPPTASTSGIQIPDSASNPNLPPPIEPPQSEPRISTPTRPPVPMGHEVQNPFANISDEDALAFEKKEHPDQYDSLLAIKTSNPAQFAHRIMITKVLMSRMHNSPQDNPELLQKTEEMERSRMNQIQIHQNVDAYQKQTDPDKKEEIKKQSMDLLSQNFDLSLSSLKRHLENQKKRLEAEAQHIQDIEANKSKFLDQQFESLFQVSNPPPEPMKESSPDIEKPETKRT